jgi:hypothetical protein
VAERDGFEPLVPFRRARRIERGTRVATEWVQDVQGALRSEAAFLSENETMQASQRAYERVSRHQLSAESPALTRRLLIPPKRAREHVGCLVTASECTGPHDYSVPPSREMISSKALVT